MRSIFGISDSRRTSSSETSAGSWIVISTESASLAYDRRIGTNIRNRIAKLEKKPARAAALAKARQRLGSSLQAADSKNEHTLAAMRLSAGLSQAKLADLMGTQQPNIARLEKNPAGLQAATVLKLAQALGVDPLKILQLTTEKSEQAMSHA